jgi:hypothetical protein
LLRKVNKTVAKTSSRYARFCRYMSESYLFCTIGVLAVFA